MPPNISQLSFSEHNSKGPSLHEKSGVEMKELVAAEKEFQSNAAKMETPDVSINSSNSEKLEKELAQAYKADDLNKEAKSHFEKSE